MANACNHDTLLKYRHVFDYFDTDRDGHLDAKCARHALLLLGFDADFSECLAVPFDTMLSKINSRQNCAATRVKRSFNLMRAGRTKKSVTSCQLHGFLNRIGMRVSLDYAERLIQSISERGDDSFTESELVKYVLKRQQQHRNANETFSGRSNDTGDDASRQLKQ